MIRQDFNALSLRKGTQKTRKNIYKYYSWEDLGGARMFKALLRLGIRIYS